MLYYVFTWFSHIFCFYSVLFVSSFILSTVWCTNQMPPRTRRQLRQHAMKMCVNMFCKNAARQRIYQTPVTPFTMSGAHFMWFTHSSLGKIMCHSDVVGASQLTVCQHALFVCAVCWCEYVVVFGCMVICLNRIQWIEIKWKTNKHTNSRREKSPAMKSQWFHFIQLLLLLLFYV